MTRKSMAPAEVSWLIWGFQPRWGGQKGRAACTFHRVVEDGVVLDGDIVV